MVVLIALLQSTQDTDGVGHTRLVHHHGLEPAFQSFVLLKIFLVFVEGGGTDTPQFSSGQCWLQDVGGIHGALTFARTHQGVDFIDEEDNVALALRHLVDHAFQTLLKLTLILRTGNQGAHVERIELLVLQVFRHIATQNPVGKAFHDGGLTGSWLTNQDWVVFCTAAQNLKHTPDLIVTPNHWVELAAAGGVDQVDGVFRQTLVVVLAALAVNALAVTQFEDGLLQTFLRHSHAFHHLRYAALRQEQSQKDGFQRHVFVAQLFRQTDTPLQHVVALAAKVGLTAAHLRTRQGIALHDVGKCLGIHTQLIENEVGHIFSHAYDSTHQVGRLNALLAVLLHKVDGLLQGLLRFDCEILEVHSGSPFFFFVCFLLN